MQGQLMHDRPKQGRMIAVVGPSGVGKDSLMTALAAQRPDLTVVRRVITRAPERGGEDYQPVSEQTFQSMAEAGEFCLQWQAHGLFYGIPEAARLSVRSGRDGLVNLSRGVLQEAQTVFGALTVLNVTASPEVLAQRLAGRGRETAAEVAARLKQADKPLDQGVPSYDIHNDGTLEEAVAQALQVLYPVSA